MIVTSTRKSRSASTPYRFTVNRERIIDGDTLLVRIDQGFDTWRTERLRLRGIDAPELYSTAGQHAAISCTKSLNRWSL